MRTVTYWGALALLAGAGLPPLAAWGGGTVADDSREAYSRPLPGLSESQRQAFLRGRSLFRQDWVVAPAKDDTVDGLGPLYNRLACLSCHPKDGRGKAPDGPEQRMQSMLVRLSMPGQGPHGGPKPHPAYGDQLNEEGIPGVPGEGRAEVHWQEVAPVTLGDGTRVPLRRMALHFVDLAYGPLDRVLTSPRVGPSVFGLGLLEGVSAADLEARARAAKPDGVRGRVNRVWDATVGKTVVGRFGWKANMPSLIQQIAGAMRGDLGITSPIFPEQNCMAGQTACRRAPTGGEPELTGSQLEDLRTYLALLAAPAPRDQDQGPVLRGKALFGRLGCAQCHQPELHTGAKAAFPQLAQVSFAPYTDLLLHDMGPGLADGRPDYRAGGREWRTPPLWGLGLQEKINEHSTLLHDGRARNVTEAILWHGGEARRARQRFVQLDRSAREDLLRFLASL